MQHTDLDRAAGAATKTVNRVPTFDQYAGPSSLALYYGDLTLWYSYQTLVGFWTPHTGKIVSENCWSNTTGKHLNAFSDKKDRLARVDFERMKEEHL